MGSHHQFHCPVCGYQAVVSGGRDRGFSAAVTTMTCRRCRELVDVLVDAPGVEERAGGSQLDRDVGRCPDCGVTDVVEWPRAKPCPKCQAPMANIGLVAMWD